MDMITIESLKEELIKENQMFRELSLQRGLWSFDPINVTRLVQN